MYSITPDISRYTSGILIGYILQLYTSASAILQLYFGYILQLCILRLYVLQLYASAIATSQVYFGYLLWLCMHAYTLIAAILHVDVRTLAIYTSRGRVYLG